MPSPIIPPNSEEEEGHPKTEEHRTHPSAVRECKNGGSEFKNHEAGVFSSADEKKEQNVSSTSFSSTTPKLKATPVKLSDEKAEPKSNSLIKRRNIGYKLNPFVFAYLKIFLKTHTDFF